MDDHGTRSLLRPALVGTQTARRSFTPHHRAGSASRRVVFAFGLIAYPAAGLLPATNEEGADA